MNTSAPTAGPLPAAPCAPELPGFPGGGESPAALLADCRRLAAHWAVPAAVRSAPVAPSLIHGTTVPAASALAVSGMPEYGG